MDAFVPGISFDLNLGALFSPLLLAVLLYALNKARDSIIDSQDKRHAENIVRFDRIETQTTATNGKVAEHELRLTKDEARIEVLMEMMLGRQPDGGK